MRLQNAVALLLLTSAVVADNNDDDITSSSKTDIFATNNQQRRHRLINHRNNNIGHIIRNDALEEEDTTDVDVTQHMSSSPTLQQQHLQQERRQQETFQLPPLQQLPVTPSRKENNIEQFMNSLLEKQHSPELISEVEHIFQREHGNCGIILNHSMTVLAKNILVTYIDVKTANAVCQVYNLGVQVSGFGLTVRV